MTIDEIIEKAIPFAPSDCKRIRAKKEWLREETKTRISQYIQLMLAAHQLSSGNNPIPPHPSGGVIFGPQMATTGNDLDGPEYFIPEADLNKIAINKASKGVYESLDKLYLPSLDPIKFRSPFNHENDNGTDK